MDCHVEYGFPITPSPSQTSDEDTGHHFMQRLFTAQKYYGSSPSMIRAEQPLMNFTQGFPEHWDSLPPWMLELDPNWNDPGIRDDASFIMESPTFGDYPFVDRVADGGFLAPACEPAEGRSRPFECDKCRKCFTRLADLKRHEKTVHNPIFQSCPIPRCTRKGTNGFPRKDHLVEHLRSFHHVDMPKRTISKRKTTRKTESSISEGHINLWSSVKKAGALEECLRVSKG